MADDVVRKGGGESVKSTAAAANPLVNGLDEEEPSFSDPEDFVDDITDEELLGDILKHKPKETDGFDTVIVVDGVPQVGPERWEKLQNVIRKIFSKFGKIVNEHFPVEKDITKGYLFLEYSSPINAQEAVKTTNGYRLDKTYTFTVNLLSDFDKYVNIPDVWSPPEPQPYKDPGKLHSWLLNSDCYDQYSVIYGGGEKTSIWSNSTPEPTLIADRNNWTETYVRWSSLGFFLATFHRRGIALWGGEDFSQISKFSHQDVQYIDFSPCEKYLVTFSPIPDSKEDPQSTVIWDLRTGARKRAFQADRSPVWPVFKWSYDDRFFARMGNEAISIYETPSFGLLEKKSFKIPGVRDFSWSPSESIIAYWVAEDGNVPARICLADIPGKNELRAKKIFSVADCKMHWQRSGEYLCVKVDRYSKIRKTDKGDKGEKVEIRYSGIYHSLEIFHVREKQIPVDRMEMKDIIAFAWEPKGSRFCLIHGESANTTVSFYEVSLDGLVALIHKFERMHCNHVFWSPLGQYCLITNLRSITGTLNFVDINEKTIINHAEHELVSDVEWDQTGRYVMTGISWWGHKSDSGFMIWSFQGKLLRQCNLDRFCQFLWRPRPPTLLKKDKIKSIRKNIKQYSNMFDAKDKQALSKASRELVEKRQNLIKAFEKYYNERRVEFLAQKQERLWLRNDIDTDTLDSHTENMEEETVEFFIQEEIIELNEE